jgi:type I restriction enzyme, S subunit
VTEDLPTGWEVVPLAAITSKLVDGSHNPPQKQDTGKPMLSAININENKISLSPCRFITEEAFVLEDKRTNVRPGNVLLTIVGAIGRTAVVPENATPFTLQRSVAVLDPIEVDPKFLMYQLEGPQTFNFFKENARGTAQKGIYLKTLGTTKVTIPPLKEQKRIAAKIEELFSELDKGIENLKTARQQLKIYRQAVLKHAFEGKLTANWRKKNKSTLEDVASCLQQLKPPQQPRGGRAASESVIEGRGAISVNKPSKKTPDGWVWIPLLRIARQETGHTPSRKHSKYWEGGNIHWISIPDARLHHGSTITDTLQKITQAGLENSSARLLPKHTVCLSRTASVGYVCVMGGEMATSQDFATWTCTEMLDPYFLMYALIAEDEHIKKFGKGTTHTTIYFPEIRALNICLPPISEQKEIVAEIEKHLSMVKDAVNDIELQLEKANILRQSILKRAFSGRLVAQNPKDEPASILLERIKAEKNESPKRKKKVA